MKDYKIGYFKYLDYYGEEDIEKSYIRNRNREFIDDYIKYINDKYNLGFNIIIVDDYTKEKCDLVVYERCEYLDNIFTGIKLFQQAKGSPKFLMHFFGEPHSYPSYSTEFNKLIRNYNTYVPILHGFKTYSITGYEDTKHNCYIPYCIDTNEIIDIENKKDIILKNKNIEKTNFCSMMFSHGSEERDTIFNLLNEYKKIRCFGKYKKNMGNIYYEDDIMFNYIMPTYKFNICFENCHSDYNESYITEKICNAFKSGTVPIYWGNNKQIYEIFNKDSFINLTDVPTKKWVDIIKEYDNNDELYYKMLNTECIIDHNITNKYMEKKDRFIVKILTEKY